MKKLQNVASPMSTRILGADGVLLPEIKSPLGVKTKMVKIKNKNIDEKIQLHVQKLKNNHTYNKTSFK